MAIGPALQGMSRNIGDDGALAVARAGTMAQDAIRAFATAPGRDVWWREAGNLRVSCAPAQDAKIAGYVDTARRLGVPDTAQPLTPAEVAHYCRSPVFRGGVFLPEGANLHPARMARALRKAVMEAGVEIYENTPMTGLDKGVAQPHAHAEGPGRRPRSGAGHQLRSGRPAGSQGRM